MTPPTPPPAEMADARAPGRPRRLAAPLAQLARWFAHQPRAVRVGLVVVLLAGSAAGAFYAESYLSRRDATRAAAAAWRDFDEAAKKADLPAARAALDRVLAARPHDPNAVRYRAILDRGEADPDTPELAAVLLAEYVRTDRLPDAAREAAKVLAKYPKHWQARCSLAHHALQVRSDPALAERLLNELPDPEDREAVVTLGGVLYALRLSEVLGRDTAGLRRAIARRVGPFTRTPAAASAPAAAKAQIVACFLEGFADPSDLGDLRAYWAAADKLVADGVTEALAAGDADALARLAELGPRMRAALAALRDHDPARLPDDRLAPLLKAIDDRTRGAWQAVRRKEPTRAAAYRGLALLALREDDPAAAVRQLLDGLAACGDRAELLELLTAVVARHGTETAIRDLAEAMWAAAAREKTDTVKWCLAASLALVLDRRDAAERAVAQARALVPNHPWACATEARLRIDRGDFLAAGESLAPLSDAVFTDPVPARLRARVLVGSGLWVLIDDEFRKLTEAQARAKVKSSEPAVAFLFGVLDAPPAAPRAAWVAARAELLLAADPAAPRAAFARAAALYRLAELSAVANPDPARPPVWDADWVAAALRAFDRLPTAERADPAVIAAVASLQLKGQGNAAAALRTVTPLLAAEATLSAGPLEVAGAVLDAMGRPKDAVRVLEHAAKFPRPSAGCLVALAVAYHHNRQPLDARATLAAAGRTPDRSDREQAELVAAKLLLQRENP